jgi:hypothetical protein
MLTPTSCMTEEHVTYKRLSYGMAVRVRHPKTYIRKCTRMTEVLWSNSWNLFNDNIKQRLAKQ